MNSTPQKINASAGKTNTTASTDQPNASNDVAHAKSASDKAKKVLGLDNLEPGTRKLRDWNVICGTALGIILALLSVLPPIIYDILEKRSNSTLGNPES